MHAVSANSVIYDMTMTAMVPVLVPLSVVVVTGHRMVLISY